MEQKSDRTINNIFSKLFSLCTEINTAIELYIYILHLNLLNFYDSFPELKLVWERYHAYSVSFPDGKGRTYVHILFRAPQQNMQRERKKKVSAEEDARKELFTSESPSTARQR